MRTMTAAALAELALKQGTEPVVVIEVQWTEGGSIFKYGDVESLADGVTGTIQEVAGLDNVITISGVSAGSTGESAQLSVTLSDTDGAVKNILDQNDVHKRPAWVYQWFPNLPYADRFLIFKGQVSSPIEWHEGDRTVRFDIMNQIEDAEVGFSAEEANIDYVPEDLIGKAWPLVFGTCIHIPGLRLRTPFKGTLRTGFGVRDFTLAAKLDQINKMCCPLIFAGYRSVRSPSPPFDVELVAKWQEEPGCKCRRAAQIEQWETEIDLQGSYQFGSLEILNGDIFPQGELITLDICGAKVKGIFTDTTFAVQSYTHPKRAETTIPEVRSFLGCGIREIPEQEGGTLISGGFFSARDENNNFDVAVNAVCSGSTNERNNLGWDYLGTFPTADFFWAEPGCEVFLLGDEEIVYVANILPSTILRVAAYRTFESGVRELVTIPASLYTSRISDFGNYMVTELVFQGLLSRRAEGWEDEVFISQTSSVGPNTVDILEWLIDTYTSFTTDAASFAAVKILLENYPSHFPILERRNILDVLRDIAFQARCALYLRNDEFTLLYLSNEPSVDFTLIEDDVLPKTLLMTHTETEELVTKFVAKWKEDYAIDEFNQVILRYNVKRYGTQEREFDFFIYNILELVEKSATFWIIRMGNTWRRLKLRTPITKLQSEVFDVANVTLPDFTPNTIKCLVEKASYDSDSHEIEFELWTPVRSGEQDQFIFSWPSQIEINHIWPTEEDQDLGNAGGSGPNVDVTVPAGHPLARPGAFSGANLKKRTCDDINNSYSGDILDKCRKDHGDKQPSDKDDKKPTKKVAGEGETDIPTTKNPTGDAIPGTIKANEEYIKDEADNTDGTIRDEQANDGGDGTESGNPGDGNPVDNLPCDDGDTPECQVRCIWKEQTIEKVIDGGVKTECGECGIGHAASDHGEQTLTFDSLASALAACEAIQALIPPFPPGVCNCETYPIPGTIIVPISDQTAWSVNGCEEPETPQGTSYCPSDSVGDGTGSDIANVGLEGGL